MKKYIRIGIYFLTVFTFLSIGSFFWRMCRYGDSLDSLAIEMSIGMMIAKFLFTGFLTSVFVINTNCFDEEALFMIFLLKGLVFYTLFTLIPIGIYLLTTPVEHYQYITYASYIIGTIVLSIMLYCIRWLYFVYTTRRSKQGILLK